MAIRNEFFSRREMVAGAGIGLGAGLLARSAPAASADSSAKIWSNDYWAKKGDVSLYMFRKRVGAPKAGQISASRSFPGAWLLGFIARRVSISRFPVTANTPS